MRKLLQELEAEEAAARGGEGRRSFSETWGGELRKCPEDRNCRERSGGCRDFHESRTTEPVSGSVPSRSALCLFASHEGQGSGLSGTAEEVANKRFHEKMQSASV